VKRTRKRSPIEHAAAGILNGEWMHDRIKTGVKGLDNLIDGGLVKNSVNLLSGAPGTGKTIFGAQFVYEALKNNEPALIITLEEGVAKLKKIMTLHNMEPNKYLDEGKLYVFDLGEPSAEQDKGTIERTTFLQMTDFIKNILQFSAPSRIVIDSLAPLFINYKNIDEYRMDLSHFCRFLQNSNMTSLLITEKGYGVPTRSGVEEYICDTFFYLDLIREGAILKRTFEIRKMRFSQFNNTVRTAVINQNGLDIF
jgi:circadian clock protein KaiC